MTESKITRCAVYTRKSTEIDLNQEFNSLEAQRESAENYIKSQKHNGWQLLPDRYDDGGFSGGNTERPALKRLMADIKAGKIDVLVLYKIDRLSRSLLDFMNMAEFFEQHNVSFVSVTQDINTSTSAGRMMLNILMTFSEYERDVITERIKDSIAGAKKRGKFCGGVPILGYDVNSSTKKMEINKKEAKLIKEIYKLYAESGSAFEVAKKLNFQGYHTKSWTSKKGKHHSGNKFSPKGVYRILNNPLYIGKVPHNDKIYNGEHKAIIDQKLWDKTQRLLKANSKTAPGSRRNATASPFKGLLTCGYCGGSFGLTYTGKKDRRYMYYLCMTDHARTEQQCPLHRFAAGNLDKIILQQLARIFKTPSMLVNLYNELRKREKLKRKELLKRQSELETALQKIRNEIHSGGNIAELRHKFTILDNELLEVKNDLKNLGEVYSTHDLLETCDSIEAIWEELFPAERYNLARQIIDKITLYTDHILMDIKHHGLKSLITELRSDKNIEVYQPENTEIIQLNIPILIKRWNGRKLIITSDNKNNPEPSDTEPTAIAKRLAQAHHYLRLLESGKYPTITLLAEAHNQDPSKLTKILNLVNLSPQIQKMIVEGNAPESMTLVKLYSGISADWEEQEKIYLT
jgi:site-specific DNA recombinase